MTTPEKVSPTTSTSADYQVIVDASEAVLATAKGFVPNGAITKEDTTVKDLETDIHRLSCTPDTSQYYNNLNLWLAAGTDAVGIIDEMRASYVADGWKRSKSVAEQQGKKQDPEGSYTQTLRSPEDFGLTISRGDDTDGTTILQFSVFSPCVGNPSDKPSTWGRL